MNDPGARRFSQAVSEGDGISVLVEVGDVDAARAAARQGADGIVARAPLAGLREAVDLPILAATEDTDADARLLVAWRYGEDWERLAEDYVRVRESGLDCVVEVRDEEELEEVIEHVDPEIVLLAEGAADRDLDVLDHVLALLPDVPAGKLAVARVVAASSDDLGALERAGMDAVVVHGDVTALVGVEPPAV